MTEKRINDDLILINCTLIGAMKNLNQAIGAAAEGHLMMDLECRSTFNELHKMMGKLDFAIRMAEVLARAIEAKENQY